MTKLLWLIYALVGVLNLIGEYYRIPFLSDTTKPLLMPILFLLVMRGLPNCRYKPILLAAIGFSWLGDILLMFQSSHTITFLLGLGAFLFAHVAYMMVYLRAKDNTSPGYNLIRWTVMLFVLGYYFWFIFKSIIANLEAMTIPVVVYSLVIVLMVLSAFSRFRRTTGESYYLVIFGALLFLMSDSMIALNKFGPGIVHAGLWIMLTYIMAQALMVAGILKHSPIEKPK